MPQVRHYGRPSAKHQGRRVRPRPVRASRVPAERGKDGQRQLSWGREQIAGTSEVKAQVKLRFYNSSKEQMIVERRLQVTKKKTGGGLTMKTLEGVISFVDKDKDKKVRPLHRFCHCVGKMELIRGTWDTQKRTSLSTKCAALDEEVPKQLGVSKAILENVIFCHQEESNWPLSEPAALKKKFDDIFEIGRAHV